MKLLPFNNYNLKTPKILEALNESSRSLAELKGFANSSRTFFYGFTLLTYSFFSFKDILDIIIYRRKEW